MANTDLQPTGNQQINSGPHATKAEVASTDFTGSIELGGTTIPCAVLYPDTDNPIRVFIMREVVGLLTGNKKGGLDRYISAKNLQPFVPEQFQRMPLNAATIRFRFRGRLAQGFLATDLIDLCRMYMQAERQGVLRPDQIHLADQAQKIVFAFAKVGVDAVIDEATGYQYAREGDALRQLLSKYIKDEYSQWTKRFPDEFFRQIFRLKGWDLNNLKTKKNKPSVVGKYIKTYVYEQLAPGVAERLQEVNPKNEKGNRLRKHHQHLTDDLGIPELTAQIHEVMGIMKASANWRKFVASANRAFSIPHQTTLGFDEDES